MPKKKMTIDTLADIMVNAMKANTAAYEVYKKFIKITGIATTKNVEIEKRIDELEAMITGPKGGVDNDEAVSIVIEFINGISEVTVTMLDELNGLIDQNKERH